MKIYVITKGFYSDYHICAVTTNEEKAEKLKKLCTDDLDEAEIEIYEDDETSDEPNVFWDYYYETNNVAIYEYSFSNYDEIREEVFQNKDGTITRARVFAKDAEHAKRKAQDMIAMYKAEKAGIC